MKKSTSTREEDTGVEMPTRNPLAKGPGSNEEGNVFAAPNKKDEDTLRRFQKMQIAKAFSSKSSGDHKLFCRISVHEE